MRNAAFREHDVLVVVLHVMVVEIVVVLMMVVVVVVVVVLEMENRSRGIIINPSKFDNCYDDLIATIP